MEKHPIMRAREGQAAPVIGMTTHQEVSNGEV